jgi:uncharacterized protein YceK
MKKLLIMVVLLSGCASIVDGGPDFINLSTNDGSSAKAEIISKLGVQTLTLPTILTMPKSCDDVSIRVLDDDTNNASVAVIDSGVNPWIAGNIIFGGLIGLGVDALTGAICTYDSLTIVPLSKK